MPNVKAWTSPATANAPGSLIETLGLSDQLSALPTPTSVRRTIALSFTLQGRATRTELGSYILCAALLTLALSFAVALIAPYAIRAAVSDGLTVLLAIPVPALLVRRLHDQDRTGGLVWLAAFGFMVWLVRTGIATALGIDARLGLDRIIGAIDWAVILANLIIVIFAVLPGTAGVNRFGPNPRDAS